MSKIELDDILSDYASRAKFNSNFSTLESAIDNTISRDGTAPNFMQANFDMNSNKIINLPDAATSGEPITYRQWVAASQTSPSTYLSTLVTFLQAGTGAASRTVSDKLRDIVSVKDFGATGDGTTNDTVAIVAALATGKTIYVPRGTYKVTSNSLYLSSNQELYGDGKKQSVIKAFTGTGFVLGIGCTGVLQTDMKVHDIGIGWDSSAGNVAGQRSIKISNAAYFTIDHTDIFYGLVNIQAEDCLIYQITNNTIRNGTIGINLVPSATYYPQHNLVLISHNRIESNLNKAIQGAGSGNNEFNQIGIYWNDIEGNGTNASGLNVVDITNIGKTGVGPGVTFAHNWCEASLGLRDVYLAGNNVYTTFLVYANAFYSTAVTTDNLAIATGMVSGWANGLNVTGPTQNVSFAADTTGVFLGNRIGILNNLSAALVTNVAQYTSRITAALAIAGSTTAGTHTYTSQLAKKVKHDTGIKYDFIMAIDALGTMAGNVRLTGIQASVNDGYPPGGGVITQFDGVNLPNGATGITLQVANNVTYASLVYSGDSIASGFVTAAMLTAPVYLQGFLNYETAT